MAEFKNGDRVRLKSNVSEKDNTRYNDLKGQILIVDHYHNSIDEPISIMCRIDDGTPDLWLVGEKQIELV